VSEAEKGQEFARCEDFNAEILGRMQVVVAAGESVRCRAERKCDEVVVLRVACDRWGIGDVCVPLGEPATYRDSFGRASTYTTSSTRWWVTTGTSVPSSINRMMRPRAPLGVIVAEMNTLGSMTTRRGGAPLTR